MMINKLKKILKHILNRREQHFVSKRLDISKDDENYDIPTKKLINLLNYTKKSETSYSAINFPAGYHSLFVNKSILKGQRDPIQRFKDLPFSLNGLSVLDIGCNQGGMLHSFSKEFRYGIGIDYDSSMINVANKIKSYNAAYNLDFYVFDLEKDNLDYIMDLLPENKIDLVLLLSVCMWINNWKNVIKFSYDHSDKLIFESNGKPPQQEEQIAYLKALYEKVDLIHEFSQDDPGQKDRKLLVCYK